MSPDNTEPLTPNKSLKKSNLKKPSAFKEANTIENMINKSISIDPKAKADNKSDAGSDKSIRSKFLRKQRRGRIEDMLMSSEQ